MPEQSNEEIVKSIFDNYGLPERSRQRFSQIALHGLDQRFLSGDDAYRNVAELAEIFQSSYAERNALRLNDPQYDFLNGSLEGLIVHPANGNGNNHDVSSIAEETTIDELYSILKDRLNSDYLAMISQLANACSKGFTLSLSPKEIILSLPEITCRLESLRRKFEFKGRLIIPRRPIVNINFELDPIVKFGQRRYHGNPVAFYNKHRDIYGGLSRKELYLVDRGIYDALRRSKMLEVVIPHSRTVAERKAKIIQAHSTYKGNRSRAAENLKITRKTIALYWKEAGLK